jgi:hypothetical protein
MDLGSFGGMSDIALVKFSGSNPPWKRVKLSSNKENGVNSNSTG